MWSRHPVLLGWWLTMLGLFGVGWVIRDELLLITPFFAGMILAVITYRHVHPGVLARRVVYFVLVGTLLASSATTVVAAGSTLFIKADRAIPIVGFSVLGATNLLVAIIAWRALVQPSAKRAALAGMLALLLELFAMAFDVVMNHRAPEFRRHDLWIAIALYGAVTSMGTGALACIAAVSAFDPPDEQEIPAARVLDTDTHV